MTSEQKGERFFGRMAWVLAAIVIAGFSSVQLFAPQMATPLNPLIALHGLVFLGWFILLIIQPRLIAARNLQRHMQIGRSSLLLAVAIVVLGYLVTRGANQNPNFSIGGMDAAGSVIFPFTDIINFSIAYSLAFYHRRNAAAHKRLMLMSGLLMIDPAMARLVFATGGPPPLILIGELALFAAFIVYDWRELGRPHWATLTGLGLFTTAMAAKFTVAATPQWRSFVNLLFG